MLSSFSNSDPPLTQLVCQNVLFQNCLKWRELKHEHEPEFAFFLFIFFTFLPEGVVILHMGLTHKNRYEVKTNLGVQFLGFCF